MILVFTVTFKKGKNPTITLISILAISETISSLYKEDYCYISPRGTIFSKLAPNHALWWHHTNSSPPAIHLWKCGNSMLWPWFLKCIWWIWYSAEHRDFLLYSLHIAGLRKKWYLIQKLAFNQWQKLLSYFPSSNKALWAVLDSSYWLSWVSFKLLLNSSFRRSVQIAKASHVMD